jgi:SAM-dependent methyltransferase
MNPNLNIQRLQSVLRKVGLLAMVERFRYRMSVVRYLNRNREFVRDNPGFAVPPRALAYDAYSAPDWDFYKSSGESTASWLFEVVSRHAEPNVSPSIFEWGCGPARVLRHIPGVFGAKAKIYGSDYNSQTIEWCRQCIGGVQFELNSLAPPLPFGGSQFDVIYSISVFTHLSESLGRQWIAELHRVASSNAVLIISTNGDSRRGFMLPEELAKYEHQGFLVRDKFEEGKKMFFACHSPSYLRETLFKAFSILEHVPAAFPYTGQDVWVLRKSS